MTVESTIVTLLGPLVSGRIYPDVAPPDAVRPYLTYQQVGGKSVQFLDASLPSRKNGRFQINVWSETRKQTALLALQAEAALVAATSLQPTVLGEPMATFEPDTKLYGSLQLFSLWSDR